MEADEEEAQTNGQLAQASVGEKKGEMKVEFLFLLIVLCILCLYCRHLLPGAKRRWNSRLSSSSTFFSV